MVLGAVLSLGMLAQAQQPDAQAAPPPPGPAQPMAGPHHRMNPNRQMKHLTRMLNLSDSQQAQIRPIVDDHDKQMRQLWDDTSLTPQDRRAKMRDINQDYRAKVESVLNDQQKQQFEQMLQERQEHRRGGPPPADAQQPPAQPQS